MTCSLHLASGCTLSGNALTIIGSDEVGWGAVAGPLYVVGVAVPRDWSFKGLRDSKNYTGKNRKAHREAIFESLIEEIRGHWALSIFTAEQIDQLGAQHCLVEAHTKVLRSLIVKMPKLFLDRVIVDGSLRLPKVSEAVSIPKADANFPAVSAASVIAKVLRDDAMTALARSYPLYGFEKHAGYGTEAHLKAIRKYGLCPVHRRSYLEKFLPREVQEL